MLHACMRDRHTMGKPHNCHNISLDWEKTEQQRKMARRPEVGLLMPDTGGRWGQLAWDHQNNGD